MENNAILSALSARKSVRVFTPDPVTPDERAAILNAAFQAPTAGNQQLYTILDITDPALKATLADLCDHQPFIAGAPLVLDRRQQLISYLLFPFCYPCLSHTCIIRKRRLIFLYLIIFTLV